MSVAQWLALSDEEKIKWGNEWCKNFQPSIAKMTDLKSFREKFIK